MRNDNQHYNLYDDPAIIGKSDKSDKSDKNDMSEMSEMSDNVVEEKEPTKYAGFNIRLWAFIIDAVIVGSMASVITVLMGEQIPISTEQMQETPFFRQLMFVLSSLYFIYMPTSKFEASFGKYLLKLKIIDHNGNRLTTGRSVVRFIGTILSTIIVYIGFLMIGVTAKKTGLHDMLAKTYVIKK